VKTADSAGLRSPEKRCTPCVSSAVERGRLIYDGHESCRNRIGEALVAASLTVPGLT
jgi:hypothetical protein